MTAVRRSLPSVPPPMSRAKRPFAGRAASTDVAAARTASRPLERSRSSSSASVGQAATARRACVEQLVGDVGVVDDRIAPVVELDALGQQLGAQAVRLAGDRVDAQPLAHAAIASGAGSREHAAAARSASHGPWRAWSRSSAANTRSALASSRTAPSGWRQAPRPWTSPAQRSSRSRAPPAGRSPVGHALQRRRRSRAARWRTGRTARRTCDASHDMTRVSSATPRHAEAGSATTTPAPTAAPCGRSSRSSSARPSARRRAATRRSSRRPAPTRPRAARSPPSASASPSSVPPGDLDDARACRRRPTASRASCPGRAACPAARNHRGPWRAIEREVGERLDVLDERRAAPDAALERPRRRRRSA